MTQTSSFEQSDDVLRKVTKSHWKKHRRKKGYKGKVRIPTLEELQAVTTGEEPDPDFMVFFLTHPKPIHYQVYPRGTRELISHDSPPALELQHFEIVADFIKKAPGEPYTPGLCVWLHQQWELAREGEH